ncbi:symmetrical bis(5'-nucleosyl)-tetraphosphatase [Neisseriaceae bacterium ESL0693]|nr:symmetrical bis(5'-nucleosyl)-tetraphosphatase [Neisseriaceae bacterium ESL0693]
MAHYVVGDLQGCLTEFKKLLAKLSFNPGTDTLWLTGDLVNRGPYSLETLRFVRQHDTCMQTVLGNHDLHLLALNYGHGKLKRGDTINDILNAPDKKLLLDWLRSQPLLLRQSDFIMVHAGLWPQWTASQAESLAQEVSRALISCPEQYFAQMYGNKPRCWDNTLTGFDRLRFITNVFTRMRALTSSGKLDFDYKATLADMPAGLTAWFNAPDRRNLDVTILFGHWSALGFHRQHHTVCLDTGALWGGTLTALNLQTQHITQVESEIKLNLEK